PTLTLTLSYGSQNTVTLSGQVTDLDPGGLTVQFQGAATGATTTNSDGTFSTTVQTTSLGDIQATTQDSWGLASDTAQVTVSRNAPTITAFQAIAATNNSWTLQGQVADQDPTGMLVRFGGLASLDGQTATVGSDGSFALSVQVSPDEAGMATAQ